MTYTFHVVVEREAHQWRAYCPAFESYEASTGGQTREEALAHIHSVLFINLEQILAQGAPVPVDVEIPNGTLISVSEPPTGFFNMLLMPECAKCVSRK
jgi:predicted RNase H-like HicB family nuclease